MNKGDWHTMSYYNKKGCMNETFVWSKCSSCNHVELGKDVTPVKVILKWQESMSPTIISFVSPCLSRSFFLFSFSLFSLFLFPDTFLLRIQPACHSRQSFATLYTALHPAAFQIRVSRSTDKSSTSFNFLAKGKRHHFSQLLLETWHI